ncbi:MAG: hypothetical protein JWP37_526 [Mucilaginibacter sp.]|nr:hypothetical protein [Mucilaginibacter sp.]
MMAKLEAKFFDDAGIKELYQQLHSLETDKKPFDEKFTSELKLPGLNLNWFAKFGILNGQPTGIYATRFLKV